jgi:hypothetical protein
MGGNVSIARVAVVSGAVVLAAALSVLPVGVAGAQTPSTFVTIPSNNATVSATSQLVDAWASNGVTKVQYEITGGTLTDSVIATGTPTIYGWLAAWNTTTVANGTYNLQSVATSNGVSGTSAPITITVNNPPPSTSVIIPANDADAGNDDQGLLFDAVASQGVTSVSIWTNYDRDPGLITAVPTIYGWIVQMPPVNLCSAGCVTGSLPLSVYAVASYPNGLSGTSPTVNATYEETIPGGRGS